MNYRHQIRDRGGREERRGQKPTQLTLPTSEATVLPSPLPLYPAPTPLGGPGGLFKPGAALSQQGPSGQFLLWWPEAESLPTQLAACSSCHVFLWTHSASTTEVRRCPQACGGTGDTAGQHSPACRAGDGPEPGNGACRGTSRTSGSRAHGQGPRGGKTPLRAGRTLPCTLAFSPSPSQVRRHTRDLLCAEHCRTPQGPESSWTDRQTQSKHTGRDRTSNNSQRWEGRREATGQLGPRRLGPARAALPEDGPLGGRGAGQEADGAGEKRPGLQALQRWPQRTGGARTTSRPRLGSRGGITSGRGAHLTVDVHLSV